MVIAPRKFLEKLIEQNLIDAQTANRCEIESLNKNIPIDQYLKTNTSIDPKKLLEIKAEFLKVTFIDIAKTSVSPQAINFISESIARKYCIIPYEIDFRSNSVYIATADPLNYNLLDFLEKKINNRVIFTLADEDDIIKIINTVYTQGLSPEVKEALDEVTDTTAVIKKEQTNTIIKAAPIAKIVDTILEFAVKGRASDIHIEPDESKTRIRYRIDGILQEKLSLPRTIHSSLVSRIKILSEMKIDEKRIPQDGRFSIHTSGQEVDLRVSTLPTVHGEKVVMRILKKTGGLPTLTELGLRGVPLRDLEEAITKPYGIILVTGPTGSGKTTTLYSILTILNKPSVNIVTLEDPVEYQIQGINQVQVNPQAGLTFANGLRSFLRQDPNIILVGEIRDRETTSLAIQAALTGHLVFSTLHTNDSSTAIPRLIDLGAEPFLISSVLNASIAQRIVRRICPSCAQSYEPSQEMKDNIKSVLGNLLPEKYNTTTMFLYKGRGCQQCSMTGYFGRVAIVEVLKVNTSINKLILSHSSAKDIELEAKKNSLIVMKQDGYLKALDGITTIEEVLRVAEN